MGVDATTALLRALRIVFAGATLTVVSVRSRSWTKGLFGGARHELELKLEGQGVVSKVNDFAGKPRLTLRGGHVAKDIRIVGHRRVLAPKRHVLLTLEIETVEIEAGEIEDELRVIPEPEIYPAGALRSYKLPHGHPYLLLAYPCGRVVITNAYPHPAALKLYRFADERQAKAASEILVANARLDLDDTYFVPAIRDERDPAAARRAALIWSIQMDLQLGQRLRGLGAGHYSIAHKAMAA